VVRDRKWFWAESSAATVEDVKAGGACYNMYSAGNLLRFPEQTEAPVTVRMLIVCLPLGNVFPISGVDYFTIHGK
jgi:hypothetical protein